LFNRVYYALFIGKVPLPVGLFLHDYEAQEWADYYYPQAPSVDIRPYEIVWHGAHTDEQLRPNVFFGAEELPRH